MPIDRYITKCNQTCAYIQFNSLTYDVDIYMSSPIEHGGIDLYILEYPDIIKKFNFKTYFKRSELPSLLTIEELFYSIEEIYEQIQKFQSKFADDFKEFLEKINDIIKDNLPLYVSIELFLALEYASKKQNTM